jgi:copper chaperone NosL
MIMKNIKLSWGIIIVLFLCGSMLVFVLFKPIWRIELSAPQYPEGLMMNISARGLGGDVLIINGLNHYIGMKTLHNEDFIEFKILPYLISIFAFFFFLVAILRNRKLMYVLFVLFLSFGALAMIDFWKWEYDYGHNLDPNAAIIVPGMTYQPPLIGYKQLLNFGAYSVPDIGGWLFITAGILLLLCIIIDFRVRQKAGMLNKLKSILPITCILIFPVSGCSVEPESIKVGSDNCHYCKMTISDNKFGVEVITKKGKIFKYDELHCLVAEISEGGIDITNIKDMYFTDFCIGHSLIKSQNGFYLKSDGLKGPMGGNVAVFSSQDTLKLYLKKLGGVEITMNKLISIK